MLVWAQVMAYRTDAFKGEAPKGWADFWNTKKFPGDRAMGGTGAGGWPEIEFALMAAGVPADKLYPSISTRLSQATTRSRSRSSNGGTPAPCRSSF
jgi:spermidine/putrescine-binding protein